jgi:methyl-accepting chemotaxis protein
MRNLTVFQRLALIIGILSLALVAVTGGQFMTLRSTLIDERQVKLRDMVDTAKAILSAYQDKANAGAIPADNARQLAFDTIAAMRWGQHGDYFGIYGAGTANAGVTYVHANPKYINVNRWDYKDNKGHFPGHRPRGACRRRFRRLRRAPRHRRRGTRKDGLCRRIR